MRQSKEVIREWIEKVNDEERGLTKWEQDFMEEILERIYADKMP